MRKLWSVICSIALLGVLHVIPATTQTTPARRTVVHNVPLVDMVGTKYLGQFEGGLYPGGSNTPPAFHDSVGKALASQIIALDSLGNPSITGKIGAVFLGFSNMAQEGCAKVTTTSNPPCNSWSIVGKAKTDANVTKKWLVLFSGAMGGQDIVDWSDPTKPDYDIVKTRMAAIHLYEPQVQVVILKVADVRPTVSLPAANADAYTMARLTGDAIRAIKVRYPNVKQLYLMSRIYGGYAVTQLNPEPYAYEGGFAVKKVIESQIREENGLSPDTLVGSLAYPALAPWVTWGPYLWADGSNPRSDGLKWLQTDFETDGTHPSTAGETKVANRTIQFFKTSPYSACWFTVNGICP